MNVKIKDIKRGDIWFADLPKVEGKSSVQAGKRPVIVVQNNMGNKHSPCVTVIPLTSRVKNDLPTHVVIPKNNGLVGDSIALAEQPLTIDKDKLIYQLGKCDCVTMMLVEIAHSIQAGSAKDYMEIIEELKREHNLLKYGVPIEEIRPRYSNLINELKLYCNQLNKNFHNILKENNIQQQVCSKIQAQAV